MNLTLHDTARWCVLEPDEKPSPAQLRKAILRDENVASDFSVITVPAPPRDRTAFKVSGNDKVTVVAIALFETLAQRADARNPEMSDAIEIYFDRRHDHLGWFRFEFTADGGANTSSFLPYPEAHATDNPLSRLKKYETHTEYFPSGGANGWRCRWIYAWFDTVEVFRESPVCGFNICRHRPDFSNEFSAWNFPSGNGGPDATAFGHLHRGEPQVQLRHVTAQRNGNTLVLDGETAGAKRIAWQLVTPLGHRLDMASKSQRGRWQATLPMKSWPAGRYRLVPRAGNTVVEPTEFFFDLAPANGKPGKSARDKNDFTVAMTYDFPDCLMANYYTPQRLNDEMKIIADWGVQRLHWIDYSDAPSFWRMHYWAKNYRPTVKHCGDLLTCAVQQAHSHGLEFVADFKVFDLGSNAAHLVDLQDKRSTAEEMEGYRSVVIPEIAARPEWTMASNPAWLHAASFPVTKIRFYSRMPLPEIKPGAISLRTSEDNLTYKRYRGPFTVSQGSLLRPHARWTPAGNESASGTERNWFIELSGLNVSSRYAALQIEGVDVRARQYGFHLVEAEDTSGATIPLTIATGGRRDFKDGYFFGKEWPGWNNSTDPLLQEREWRLNDFGLAFQTITRMPTMLEPAYEGARAIWLRRIEKLIEAGVDGVCIRILQHHNGAFSWLQNAFAPAVSVAFRQCYGRAPETTPEDYERVRRLRGEFFTQFLRDAKQLTGARSKKLLVQLESGIEIPPHLDTRMQIFLDYQTWLEEKIVDEVLLKSWTAQSPWIHENVLPLARRNGIPVHIVSRNLNDGLDNWAVETTPRLLTDAYEAGFSGFNFYEVQNLMELNPEGVPTPKGYAAHAIPKACHELRKLQSPGAPQP